MAKERAPKKTVVGTVVSDKMDKTITVREERMVKHPRYGKYVRRATVYKAHDEANEAEAGDRVEILFMRPVSKTKQWRLLRVVRKVRGHVEEDEASATAPAPSEQPVPELGSSVPELGSSVPELGAEVSAEAAAGAVEAVPGGEPTTEPQAEEPREGAAS